MDIADVEVSVGEFMDKDRYKKLCFNELTLQPSCPDETEMHRRVRLYAETLKEANAKLGSKVIRYENDLHHVWLSDDVSLFDFCSRHRTEPGVGAILSSHTMPAVDPDDTEEYSNYERKLAYVTIAGTQRDSNGLAAAYVYDVPAVGFDSEECWRNVMHPVTVMPDEGSEQTVELPCLTAPEHLSQENFQRWLQERQELKLLKSELDPGQKLIDVGIDHGNDILFKHARRLCNSEYVTAIQGSLPYRPKYRSYVYDMTEDGLVDIVLFWDDRGLSMRVKTTGRNLRETAAIADTLTKKYSL